MINYKIGDATSPEAEGLKILPHICNDIGAWGSGYVVALSARWPEPERRYREFCAAQDDKTLPLGLVMPVQVEEDIVVMNMIAQNETIRTNSKPIDYEALFTCLSKVYKYCLVRMHRNPTVHMPRIGCDRARGKWDVVEALVYSAFTNVRLPVDVTVYDLPHG